jgi:hypothetical protein
MSINKMCWLINEQSTLEMFKSKFKPWSSKWHTNHFVTQLPLWSYYMWSQILNLFDIVSIRAKNYQFWYLIFFFIFCSNETNEISNFRFFINLYICNKWKPKFSNHFYIYFWKLLFNNNPNTKFYPILWTCNYVTM